MTAIKSKMFFCINQLTCQEKKQWMLRSISTFSFASKTSLTTLKVSNKNIGNFEVLHESWSCAHRLDVPSNNCIIGNSVATGKFRKRNHNYFINLSFFRTKGSLFVTVNLIFLFFETTAREVSPFRNSYVCTQQTTSFFEYLLHPI